MSKTDKTRPYAVRATETPMRSCHPVHDHRDGVCDLPSPVAAEYGFRGGGVCYWTEAPAFLYGRGHGCGCATCTGQVFRLLERRAIRRAAATVCRDVVAVHRAGGQEALDGYDDHVAHVPQW